MPASMMMPPAGSILKVSGSSSAMVAAGPRPGRMPTTVPRKQPTKHQNRFVGCSATENPCSNPPNTSMSEPEHAGGQRDAQRKRERQIEAERRHHRGHARHDRRLSEHEGDDEEGEDRERDHEPEPVHQERANRERSPSDQRAADAHPIG